VENGKKTIRGEESKPVEGERSTGHEYKLRWQKNIGKERERVKSVANDEKERKGKDPISSCNRQNFCRIKKVVKLFSEKKNFLK